MTIVDQPPVEGPTPPAEPAEPDTPAARRRANNMQPLGGAMAALMKKLGRPWPPADAPPPEPEPVVVEIPGVDPLCLLCRGFGRMRQDLPIGHPDFGQLLACPDCLGPHLERVRVERIWHAVPGQLRKYPVDSYPGAPQVLTAVQAWRKQAIEPDCETPWLFLTGARGTGKSSLAAGVGVQLALDLRGTLVFANVPDLIDRLRATQAPDSEYRLEDVLGSLFTADIVVVDDLGTQRMTPFAEEKCFQVFDSRNNEARLTIVTSNLDLPVLERASDIMARIVDRILERAQIVSVPEPSLRALRAAARNSGKPWPPPK